MPNLRIVDWAKNFENNRTKDMKVMQWVPIPNKMDGLGYLTLVDHPNGAQHFAAWVAIVEIASRQKVRGTLPQAPAGIPQALARISRMPAGIFEEAIPRLIELQWIEQDAGGCGETAGKLQDACAEGKGREGKEENGMGGNGNAPTPIQAAAIAEFQEARQRYEPLDEAPGPSLVELTLEDLRCQYDAAGFLIGDIATARAKLEQILAKAVHPERAADRIKISLAAHMVHWKVQGRGKELRYWLQNEEYLSTPAPPTGLVKATKALWCEQCFMTPCACEQLRREPMEVSV